MEMGHALSRLDPAVGHHPEALQAQFLRRLGDDLEDVSRQGGIVCRDLPADLLFAGCETGRILVYYFRCPTPYWQQKGVSEWMQ